MVPVPERNFQHCEGHIGWGCVSKSSHNDFLQELMTLQMSSYSLASVISIMLWIITMYHVMKRPY